MFYPWFPNLKPFHVSLDRFVGEQLQRHREQILSQVMRTTATHGGHDQSTSSQCLP